MSALGCIARARSNWKIGHHKTIVRALCDSFRRERIGAFATRGNHCKAILSEELRRSCEFRGHLPFHRASVAGPGTWLAVPQWATSPSGPRFPRRGHLPLSTARTLAKSAAGNHLSAFPRFDTGRAELRRGPGCRHRTARQAVARASATRWSPPVRQDDDLVDGGNHQSYSERSCKLVVPSCKSENWPGTALFFNDRQLAFRR